MTEELNDNEPSLTGDSPTTAPPPSLTSRRQIARLGLPSLVLSVVSASLQLLTIIILLPSYCIAFRDLGVIRKLIWVIGWTVILCAYMIPSVVVSIIVWWRLKKGTHFAGKFQVSKKMVKYGLTPLIHDRGLEGATMRSQAYLSRQIDCRTDRNNSNWSNFLNLERLFASM